MTLAAGCACPGSGKGGLPVPPDVRSGRPAVRWSLFVPDGDGWRLVTPNGRIVPPDGSFIGAPWRAVAALRAYLRRLEAAYGAFRSHPLFSGALRR